MTQIKLEPITIPGDLFNERQIKRVLVNIFRQRAKSIKVDFGVTTQTWDTDVKFTIQKDGEIDKIIGTDSDIYKWVSGGTKPHIISPRNSPFLQFKTGYKAKTKVRVIASRPGGAKGGVVRLAAGKSVNHPGTKARKFDEVIAEKWQKILPAIIDRAIQSELARQ